MFKFFKRKFKDNVERYELTPLQFYVKHDGDVDRVVEYPNGDLELYHVFDPDDVISIRVPSQSTILVAPTNGLTMWDLYRILLDMQNNSGLRGLWFNGLPTLITELGRRGFHGYDEPDNLRHLIALLVWMKNHGLVDLTDRYHGIDLFGFEDIGIFTSILDYNDFMENSDQTVTTLKWALRKPLPVSSVVDMTTDVDVTPIEKLQSIFNLKVVMAIDVIESDIMDGNHYLTLKTNFIDLSYFITICRVKLDAEIYF